MTLANQITLLRIVLVPLISIILLSPCFPYNGITASLLFLAAALSDLADGHIARKYGQISDLGKVFDPLADKLLVTITLLCLVQIGSVSAIPVMIIVARDLLVEGLRAIASSRGMIIAASMGGKWKTAVMDAAVLMLILGIPYGLYVLWTAVALSVISGIDYMYRSRSMLND